MTLLGLCCSLHHFSQEMSLMGDALQTWSCQHKSSAVLAHLGPPRDASTSSVKHHPSPSAPPRGGCQGYGGRGGMQGGAHSIPLAAVTHGDSSCLRMRGDCHVMALELKVLLAIKQQNPFSEQFVAINSHSQE